MPDGVVEVSLQLSDHFTLLSDIYSEFVYFVDLTCYRRNKGGLVILALQYLIVTAHSAKPQLRNQGENKRQQAQDSSSNR
jgi:hypothetical protein